MFKKIFLLFMCCSSTTFVKAQNIQLINTNTNTVTQWMLAGAAVGAVWAYNNNEWHEHPDSKLLRNLAQAENDLVGIQEVPPTGLFNFISRALPFLQHKTTLLSAWQLQLATQDEIYILQRGTAVEKKMVQWLVYLRAKAYEIKINRAALLEKIIVGAAAGGIAAELLKIVCTV